MTPTEARTYTVQAFRDSGLWVIEVPEIDAVGQARTLASAADTARTLIALWLDVDPETISVEMDYSRIDPDALTLMNQARADQARAEAINSEAAKTWRQAARRLVRDDHLSLRDAAIVLGVSYGRVQQLVS
ncbi:hypothetical protein [Pseudonocardia alaniniphila]|uniref:Antitoxin HicB n=1 Tax=Pseudonocardia alaniniphila TaxID=75291 RepID=A0ABS9THY6_9PSEU|nr:hypothetical protein [Pseudonocardia alaniniphila]MCH6168139.1 hypothetical protein [Pseudonocardia alaniniphila]